MTFTATAIAFDEAHMRVAEAESVCSEEQDAVRAAMVKLQNDSRAHPWTSIEIVVSRNR